MHTPTLVSTAFTAAVLFAGSGHAAPIRRGSVVDEDIISPRSGPPSRRGSTTEDLSSSRRGSIADDIMASRRRSIVADPSDLARRGSAPSPMDIANARRRSSVIVDPSSPARRSSLAAAPQDIMNARRRSIADGAVPPLPPQTDEMRRSSAANDIFAARKRSLIDGQPMRRSSLANPADLLAARKRSMTPSGAGTPERRSVSGSAQVHPAASPNRKAFVAEPVEISEDQQVESRSVDESEIKPFNLPNRKAFIAPSEGNLHRRDESAGPKNLAINLPNRKAFIQSEDAQIKVTIDDAPNFNTYSFPATPAGEKRDYFDPASLPRSKAFIHPDSAKLDATTAKLNKKPYTFPPAPNVSRRTFDPSTLPNRKAFIHPDELKVAALSVDSNEADEEPVLPARLGRRALDPSTLPNRKAYVAAPAAAHEDGTSAPKVSSDKRDLDPSKLPNRKAFIASSEPSKRDLDPSKLPNRKAYMGPSSDNSASDKPKAESKADESSEKRSEGTGTAIPLTKREVSPLAADGVVDIDRAQAHLEHISIKYQKGIMAYQKRTGEPLFDSKRLTEEEMEEEEAHLAKRSEALEADSHERLGLTRGARRAGVSLKSYNSDLLWAGPVKIGTPAQDFVLDFDTGSADTWVPASSCTSDACSSHNRYDPSKSSTAELQDGVLDMEYGDGSATKGKVYTDTVTVGGVTAKNQAIGVATTLSKSFADDPQDGIMGMGYESISTLKEKPFFQTLMADGSVAKPQFSFSLNTAGQDSELYLGGANSNKFQGDLEWHDVVSESYWVLEGEAYVDNNKASDDFYAIVDTGTTVVVAPPAEAEAFWDKVPGSEPYAGGYYTFPCNEVPDVSFSFGGKKWEMDADTLNLGSTASGSERCVGSVVGMDVGVSAWIMGDSFLKNVYTTFDFDKNAVGFAEKKEDDN